MKYQSTAWFEMINAPREEAWQEKSAGCIYPSITHALHPRLRKLFERVGTCRWVEGGEAIVRYGEHVNAVMLVLSGITAREVGRGDGNAIAISVPGRFACGNLNFFTAHPCIGSYFAIVRSCVAVIKQTLLQKLIAEDAELWQLLCINAELCNLSDRMTFLVLTQLPAEERLKSFFLAWAACYANWVPEAAGEGWLQMPATIQRRYLVSAAAMSQCTLDAVLKDWSHAGQLRREGASLFVRPSLLEDCYRWICRMEEPSRIRRPATFLDTFKMAQRG